MTTQPTTAEILAVIQLTYDDLCNLTTEQFSFGGDRPARDRLAAMIERMTGKPAEPTPLDEEVES